MIDVAKIFSVLKDFLARVFNITKPQSPSKDTILEHNAEYKKETCTAKVHKNGISFKQKIIHKKTNISLHIGFHVDSEKDKFGLFISINNVNMLMNCKYLAATPLCSGGEQCSDDGEVRYYAIEQINKEYFSDTTTEDRRDEIIEQILTEVAEVFSNQCSTGE